MQNELSEILHNIADHTETFFRFLNETNLTPDLKNRLIDHIILEEQENTSRLQELHKTSPSGLTQKLLDHSFILQRIMLDATMPLDLKQELLHHFMEEHTEWQRQLGAQAWATGSSISPAETSPHLEHSEHASHYEAADFAHQRSYGGTRQSEAPAPAPQRSGSRSKLAQGVKHTQETKLQQESRSQETGNNGWTIGPMWNQGG